jgi:hypothetical protein
MRSLLGDRSGGAPVNLIVRRLVPTRDNLQPRSKPRVRLVLVGLGLAALGSIAALYRLITLAIEKTRAGEGLETYRTFWLVEFNYIGVLIVFAALIVALVIAVALRWREEWLWRDLESKYGAKDTDA